MRSERRRGDDDAFGVREQKMVNVILLYGGLCNIRNPTLRGCLNPGMAEPKGIRRRPALGSRGWYTCFYFTIRAISNRTSYEISSSLIVEPR